MNYLAWGAEYLAEAAALKRRVDKLRKQFTGLHDEESILLYRRIATLYEMYLECLRTGKYLTEKGEFYEKRQNSESGFVGELYCGGRRGAGGRETEAAASCAEKGSQRRADSPAARMCGAALR
jgi:hypothetical protein